MPDALTARLQPPTPSLTPMADLLHRFLWRRLHSTDVAGQEIKVFEEHRLTKARRCRVLDVERIREVR